MRLNKYLAHCGVASRRKCDQLIQDGKISINGKIVVDYSYHVSSLDIVVFDNSAISLDDSKYSLYLLNKPKGYICSNAIDNSMRVIDLIKSNSRLYTVGRLDVNTTGAILVTNNGDLANKLSHPRYNKQKKYIVKTIIDIPRDKYNQLKSGLNIGQNQKAKGVLKRIKKENKYIYWDIILSEGKNREIRRIFENLGSEVIDLHRYEFAGLNVNNVKQGSYKKIKFNFFK
tara:strand:- start:100 stop:786 length:687 start_codon:yes stop_codon:yes gene_type:complete